MLIYQEYTKANYKDSWFVSKKRNYKAYPIKRYIFLYLETFAIRQFMRGTDPTKSTWVYPKLIL